jgi:hypothetical protein
LRGFGRRYNIPLGARGLGFSSCCLDLSSAALARKGSLFWNDF